MYIIACRAHFCHLPGLGQVGHSPRGTSGSAGTLDWGPMWSGSQFTCHPQCPPDTSCTPCHPLMPLHPCWPWMPPWWLSEPYQPPWHPLLAPWHLLHHCHPNAPWNSYTPWYPETQCPWAAYNPGTPAGPWHPLSQNGNLVVKSGTTACEYDMLAACGSGSCFVTCTSFAIVFSFQLTIFMSLL